MKVVVVSSGERYVGYNAEAVYSDYTACDSHKEDKYSEYLYEEYEVIGAPAFKFQLVYDPSENFNGVVTVSGSFDTLELAYKHIREQVPMNIQKYFKVVAVAYLEEDVNDFMFRSES